MNETLAYQLICLLLCVMCFIFVYQNLTQAEQYFEMGYAQCFNDRADSILKLPIPNGTGEIVTINWTLPYQK